MARAIRTPGDGRFSCRSCGNCCRGWTVTVDADTVGELRKHDWGVDPFVTSRGTDDAYRIKMVDGHCFFLDDNDRCRIHSEISYDAKPAGCKAFPLHFAEVGGATYARLSFFCPTVVENLGKPLNNQMRWMRATLKSAGDVARSEAVCLTAELPITTAQLQSVEDILLNLLSDESRPMADRLASGATLLSNLISTAKGGALPALKSVRANLDAESLARRGRQGGSAARAGPLLSMYLAQDCSPAKLARLGRFFGIRAFNLGIGRLRSRAVQAKASRRQIRRVAFDLSPRSSALITRYLTGKLRSRRYLSGSATVVSGFNLLVTAYAVVHLLARVRAAGSGRQICSDEDVSEGIRAAELLVVEHSALQRRGLFATLTETILSDQHLCASILARLER